jgi:hypothetical protein
MRPAGPTTNDLAEPDGPVLSTPVVAEDLDVDSDAPPTEALEQAKRAVEVRLSAYEKSKDELAATLAASIQSLRESALRYQDYLTANPSKKGSLEQQLEREAALRTVRELLQQAQNRLRILEQRQRRLLKH